MNHAQGPARTRARLDRRSRRNRTSSPLDLAPLERVAYEVAAEWDLKLGPPFALSRYSYVAPAGGDAVLKVTPLEDDESDGCAALRTSEQMLDEALKQQAASEAER